MQIKKAHRGQHNFCSAVSLVLTIFLCSCGQGEIKFPPRSILPTEHQNGITSGLIESSFQVTHNGAASYTIPLWVPPGKLNMQPSLSVEYNSHAGNGILGMGWNLTGLSEITRSRKTFAYDSIADPIHFDASDAFSLDGERLVLVDGSNGSVGAEYKTFQNNFSKIVVEQSDALGPKSFVVYEKNGRILHYGLSSDAIVDGDQLRVYPKGTGLINDPSWTIKDDYEQHVFFEPEKKGARYKWLLKQIEDRFGNTIDYSYRDLHSRVSSGLKEKVIASIEYTGSVRSGNLTTGSRKVQFTYEPRPDVDFEWVSGFYIWHGFRLQEVLMLGPDPSTQGLLKRYRFKYSAGKSERSLLQSLDECDGEKIPICKQPVTFEYQDNTPGYEDIKTNIEDVRTTPGGRSRLPGRLHIVDLNGDGRDDIFYARYFNPGQYVFRLASEDVNGKPTFGDPVLTSFLMSTRPERPYPMDFNSDGHSDILIFNDEMELGHSGENVGYLLNVAITDPSSETTRLETIKIIPSLEAEYAETADLNGDHITDLLSSSVSEHGKDLRTWNYQLTSNGTLGPRHTITSTPLPEVHRLLDIDGDGSLEVLARVGMPEPGAWYSAFKLGRAQSNGALISTTLTELEKYFFADLNNDGLVDAISAGLKDLSGEGPRISINSGNGFLTPDEKFLTLEYTRPIKRVIDYNLDGKSDIMMRTITVTQTDTIYILQTKLEAGAIGFAKPVSLPHISTWIDKEDNQVTEVLDVNGDGLDDFVMYSDGFLHLYVRNGKKPDLLTKVSSVNGPSITVRYEPTSNKNVYTPRVLNPQYPLLEHKSKMWVVAEHTESNGIGGLNHFVYKYRAGKMDQRNSAFLGFEEFVRTHVETGETVLTDFDLSAKSKYGLFALKDLPIYEEKRTPLLPGRDKVSYRHLSYGVKFDATNKSYFVFADTIRSEEGVETEDKFVPLKNDRQIITVDDFGNILKEDTKNGDGWRLIQSNIYSVNPLEWLISSRTLSTTTSFSPDGATAKRTTAFEFDPFGAVKQIIMEPETSSGSWGPLPKQQDGVQTLYISFERYSDGQLKSYTTHKLPVPSSDARTTTIIYDPDEGIFPYKVTDAIGHLRFLLHHPGFGLLVLTRDQNGLESTVKYDGFARMREELYPNGLAVHQSYLDANPVNQQRITQKINNGTKTAVDFDDLGRLVRIVTLDRADNKEVFEEIAYDPQGRVERVSDPHFVSQQIRWTTFNYDPLGRLLNRSNPDGTQHLFAYGDSQTPLPNVKNILNRRTRIDPSGHKQYTVTDMEGRVLTTIEPIDNTQITNLYSYGPFGVLRAITSQGVIHSFEYDRLGRLVSSTSPTAGVVIYHYDEFGDLVSFTDEGGISEFKRDLAGRLTESITPDGKTMLEWDIGPFAKGKLSKLVSPFQVTTSFQYDNKGQLTGKSWEIEKQHFEMAFRYDKIGRLDGITYPQVTSKPPFSVYYTFGAHGQLTGLYDSKSNKPFWILVDSDASGFFGIEKYGNGVTLTTKEHVTAFGQIGTIKAELPNKKTIQDLEYDYDKNGNVVKRVDKVVSTTEGLEYDDLNQLVKWTIAGPTINQSVGFNYDLHHNLRETSAGEYFDTDLSKAGPNAAVNTSLGDYSYDAKGNQISGNERQVSYTSFNLPRLVTYKGEKTTIGYDGMHQRVLTASQNNDKLIQLDNFYDLQVRGGKEEQVFNLIVAGSQVGQVNIGSSGINQYTHPYYLHTDNIGSLNSVSDDQGQDILQQRFDPFGKKTVHSATTAVTFDEGFAGHRDGPGGLVDMRGRMYDPLLGRFITADPMIQDVTESSSLNPYSYVFNNPLSWIDPSGFETESTTYYEYPDETVYGDVGFGFPGEPNGPTWEECYADPACVANHVVDRDKSKDANSSSPINDEGLGSQVASLKNETAREQSWHQDGDNYTTMRAKALEWTKNHPRSQSTTASLAIDMAGEKVKNTPKAMALLSVSVPVLMSGGVILGMELSAYELVQVPGVFSGLGVPTARMVYHHVFPQARLFAPYFAMIGLRIHNFTVRIPEAVHQELHLFWNPQWEQFIGESIAKGTWNIQNAMRFGEQMRYMHNLQGHTYYNYFSKLPSGM